MRLVSRYTIAGRLPLIPLWLFIIVPLYDGLKISIRQISFFPLYQHDKRCYVASQNKHPALPLDRDVYAITAKKAFIAATIYLQLLEFFFRNQEQVTVSTRLARRFPALQDRFKPPVASSKCIGSFGKLICAELVGFLFSCLAVMQLPR
jgi:hypothetical protein